MSEKFANKVARAVHAAPVSAEFDLAGYTRAQCEQLGTELFAHTFRVPEQFRISFIIGGGREVRQKYDADLTKWLTEVLREHGFEDDGGASTANDCQKKFKYQDDTGKNLKRLHVFPSSEIVAAGADGGEGGSGGALSNEEKIIRATAEALPQLLSKHVPTWLHHKRVNHILKQFAAKVAAIEDKMIKVQPLDEAEVELYHTDYADKEVVARKLDVVAKKMKHFVASGLLTAAEKEHLVANAQEKLAGLEKQLAEVAGSSASPDALMKAVDQVKARVEKLKAIKPRDRPLKREDEIKKVRTERR
jgi:hypothetical protein